MTETPYSGNVYTFRRFHLPRFSELLPRRMEWDSSPFWGEVNKNLIAALGPSKRIGKDGYYDSHLAIFENMEFDPRYTETMRRSKKPLRIGLRCWPLPSFLYRALKHTLDGQWQSEYELREVVNEAISGLIVAELDYDYLVFSRGERVHNASEHYTDVQIMTKWDAVDQARRHLVALEGSLRDLNLPRDQLASLKKSLNRVSGRQAVHDALKFLHAEVRRL